MLDLNCCIITKRSLTNHAMGCQREIAQRITQAGADYVLAVKENQGQLYENIQDPFTGAEAWGFDGVPYDHRQTMEKGHGRVERRECWVIAEAVCLDYLDPQGQWPELKAAVRVVGLQQTLPVNPATTSAAWRDQRSNCWPPSEAIGASKTRCTGPWT